MLFQANSVKVLVPCWPSDRQQFADEIRFMSEQVPVACIITDGLTFVSPGDCKPGCQIEIFKTYDGQVLNWMELGIQLCQRLLTVGDYRLGFVTNNMVSTRVTRDVLPG